MITKPKAYRELGAALGFKKRTPERIPFPEGVDYNAAMEFAWRGTHLLEAGGLDYVITMEPEVSEGVTKESANVLVGYNFDSDIWVAAFRDAGSEHQTSLVEYMKGVIKTNPKPHMYSMIQDAKGKLGQPIPEEVLRAHAFDLLLQTPKDTRWAFFCGGECVGSYVGNDVLAMLSNCRDGRGRPCVRNTIVHASIMQRFPDGTAPFVLYPTSDEAPQVSVFGVTPGETALDLDSILLGDEPNRSSWQKLELFGKAQCLDNELVSFTGGNWTFKHQHGIPGLAMAPQMMVFLGVPEKYKNRRLAQAVYAALRTYYP